jgi:hypothetical protein
VNGISYKKSSMRGFTSFLEVLWSCSDDRREIGAAGCRGPLGRDDTAGLVCYANSFANLRVFLLTDYTFTAHARVLQKHGRHTRVASGRTIATPGHISYAISVLLSHHWPSTCSRVVRCLAYARACGNEPSRPLVKHFRSHSRTRRFNSARTSMFCNFAVPSTCCDALRFDLPPPPVLHCTSNLCRVAPASTFV